MPLGLDDTYLAIMGHINMSLIYQASGAVEYDTNNPIPLHYQNAWSGGHSQFGYITVPEFNHILTPLGIKFMKAVTLDSSDSDAATLNTDT